MSAQYRSREFPKEHRLSDLFKSCCLVGGYKIIDSFSDNAFCSPQNWIRAAHTRAQEPCTGAHTLKAISPKNSDPTALAHTLAPNAALEAHTSTGVGGRLD